MFTIRNLLIGDEGDIAVIVPGVSVLCHRGFTLSSNMSFAVAFGEKTENEIELHLEPFRFPILIPVPENLHYLSALPTIISYEIILEYDES